MKCGVLPHNTAEPRDVTWIAQGEEIPLVDSYRYLGVILDTRMSVTNIAKHRELALKASLGASKAFLSSKSIPLMIRLTLLKALALPIATYGAEAFGMNQENCRKMTSFIAGWLRRLIGRQPRSPVALTTLSRELGVPIFHAAASARRARILYKLPTLSTWGKTLWSEVTHTPKRTPITQGRVWLRTRKMPDSGNPKELSVEVRSKVTASHESANSSLSLSRYIEHNFQSTRRYIKRAAIYPEIGRGLDWLIQARVDGFWDTKKAVRLLIPRRGRAGSCPLCLEKMKMTDIAHLLLECESLDSERDEILSRTISDIKVLVSPSDGVLTEQHCPILLGGEVNGGVGLGKTWVDVRRMNSRETLVPHWVQVAKFLRLAVPRYYGGWPDIFRAPAANAQGIG